MFGLPIERWKPVPVGADGDSFTGIDSMFGIKPGKTIKVEIETLLPEDQSHLTIKTKSRVADTWSTYEETNSTQVLHPGDQKKARVFAVTAGHQVVYRWNGKK